jgi:hypothetical protein
MLASFHEEWPSPGDGPRPKFSLGLDRAIGIPEALMINREAAAYWITRFRG